MDWNGVHKLISGENKWCCRRKRSGCSDTIIGAALYCEQPFVEDWINMCRIDKPWLALADNLVGQIQREVIGKDATRKGSG